MLLFNLRERAVVDGAVVSVVVGEFIGGGWSLVVRPELPAGAQAGVKRSREVRWAAHPYHGVRILAPVLFGSSSFLQHTNRHFG